MKTPMPSPRGTNHERLFLTASPRAAYDAAIPDDVGGSVLAFLRDKLSPDDLTEFCKMLEIDPNLGMDEPVPFKGMPLPGGEKYAQDARRRASFSSAENADFAKRFPHAATIRVNR